MSYICCELPERTKAVTFDTTNCDISNTLHKNPTGWSPQLKNHLIGNLKGVTESFGDEQQRALPL